MAGKLSLSWVTPLLLAFHSVAWVIAMLMIWLNHDPAQPSSGPTFNNARMFLSRLDALVYPQIESLAGFLISRSASRVDPGTIQWVMFTMGVLAAGSVQWYLIGRLVGWIETRYGKRLAVMAVGALGLWLGAVSTIWIIG